MCGCLISTQIAGRGEGHIDFEGFCKIYDEIMTVKEVSCTSYKKRNNKKVTHLQKEKSEN